MAEEIMSYSRFKRRVRVSSIKSPYLACDAQVKVLPACVKSHTVVCRRLLYATAETRHLCMVGRRNHAQYTACHFMTERRSMQCGCPS
jgi:hypothetical protein